MVGAATCGGTASAEALALLCRVGVCRKFNREFVGVFRFVVCGQTAARTVTGDLAEIQTLLNHLFQLLDLLIQARCHLSDLLRGLRFYSRGLGRPTSCEAGNFTEPLYRAL